MSEANLRGNLLDQINLQNANLSGADFRFSSMRDTNLSGANLQGANLSNADLQRTVLTFANLQGADLSGALLSGANARSAKLEGASLVGTDLSFANLADADLANVTFYKSFPISAFQNQQSYQGFYDTLNTYECRDGVFLVQKGDSITPIPVNFSQDQGIRFYANRGFKDSVAYLCIANLTGANLQSLGKLRYDLAGVNMSQADVSSSDLSQAILNDVISGSGWVYPLTVNLEGIVYNALTEWPPDFTPPLITGAALKAPSPLPTPPPEKSE